MDSLSELFSIFARAFEIAFKILFLGLVSITVIDLVWLGGAIVGYPIDRVF